MKNIKKTISIISLIVLSAPAFSIDFKTNEAAKIHCFKYNFKLNHNQKTNGLVMASKPYINAINPFDYREMGNNGESYFRQCSFDFGNESENNIAMSVEIGEKSKGVRDGGFWRLFTMHFSFNPNNKEQVILKKLEGSSSNEIHCASSFRNGEVFVNCNT